MTVKNTDTKTSSTSKKKTSSSSASTSKTSSKTSKVVGSTSTNEETVQTGGLSKSSSASSLQISDVSHLPVKTNVVTYVVTEALPTGSGEKITTYTETGATATEYRHFIAQDSSVQHSTDIQQIGSDLNQSISNLSQASGATYTVTEPMEELKLTYNINDSAWNGKFVQEKPSLQGKTSNTVVEQTSSSTSHQESSSTAKSSSSSYAVEIVDGKERIIDKKHHETSHATRSSNDESLDMKSGTNITPEVHYKQKATESNTTMDTAVPELQQPKTKSSEAVREIHQVGDEIVTSTNVIKDNAKNVSSKHAISNKNKQLIDKEQVDTVKKQSSSTSSDKASKQKSKILGGTSTLTSTTTYYDSKGNIIKTSSDVDTQNIPGSEIVTDSSDKRKTQVLSNIDISNIHSDSKNIYEHVDTSTASKTTQNILGAYGKVMKDNTIDTTDILSNDRVHGKSTSRNQSSPDRKGKPRTKSPSKKPKPVIQKLDDTTHYVDENYVNTSKIRNAQVSSDSSNFYGHNVDSSTTMVDNIYDSNAVQNTIGYKGRVIMDQNIDDKNIVYSNDRNYGKTGWNGQFTYEKPQQIPSDTRKSKSPERKPSPSTKPERKSTHDLPAAGAPSRKDDRGKKVPEGKKTESPTRKPNTKYPQKISPTRKTTDTTQDFISTETEQNIKQFTDDDATRKSSTIYTEGPTTIEYFKIVDGKEIPVGKKVIPGSTTETHDSSITSDRNIPRDTYDSKTTTIRYKIVDGKEIPIGTSENIVTSSDEHYEYSVDGSNIVEHYTIIDGKRVPLRPDQLPTGGVVSRIDHKTPEIPDSTIVETVSKVYDAKTTITKDGQTFVDNQFSQDHYTIVDGKKIPSKKFPEELPAAGVPSRKPKRPESPTKRDKLYEKGPQFPEVDSTTVLDSFESVSNKYDSKTTVIKDSQTFVDKQGSEEHYIIVNGERIPIEDTRKPSLKSPDELPTAGMPSRKPKKPDDEALKKKPESPNRKEKIHPEDYPAVGKPSSSDDKSVSPSKKGLDFSDLESTTVVETFETVSNVFDTKSKVIKDSQKFVDRESTEEYYIIVDGKKVPSEPKHNKEPVEDAKKPLKKHPEDLPAAGIPSQKPKGSDEEAPKKRQESPSKKGKLHPEDLPSAGKPSKPQDKRLSPSKGPNFPDIDSTTTVESVETVSKAFDSKTTVIKDSQTILDNQSMVEHYTIVNGEKIPLGPKDRKPIEETKKFPEKFPAAGMPSRTPKKPEDETPKKKSESPHQTGKLHPEDYPAAGKPSTSDDNLFTPFKKGPDFPDVESTTVVKTLETVSNVFDTKSKVIKDLQTFVDRESTEEYYTIVDGRKIPSGPKDKKLVEGAKEPLKKHPEDLPAAGMPSQKPKGPDEETPKTRQESPSKKGKLRPEDLPTAGRPSKPEDKALSPSKGPDSSEVDSTTTVESVETVSKKFDSKTTIVKDSQTFVDNQSIEENYTIINGEKIPLGPKDRKPIEDTKPHKKFPEELPAAGMPSRKPKKPEDETPKKKSESPHQTGKLHPEDYPAAGKPSTSDDLLTPFKKGPDFPNVESTTVVETFQTGSNVFDTKSKVIKDSQTFVDRESTEEYYTIVDGRRIPSGPKDKKPVEDAKKPSKKHFEDLPAAGMPSRKPKGSDEKPKKRQDSPSKKDKLHPEDLPSAGKPSKPQHKRLSPSKGPDFPEIDSATTVESFETVSKTLDSKTTVIKDSQTFVDKQSTEEHYTIVNGEKIPLGPKDREPIEDTKKFPEELPAAGMPSRKPKKPEDETPKKKPETPHQKGKLHPEDYPAAGKPSSSPDFPEVESTTVVETFQSVSDVFDTKSNVIKDSQTFVDRESTEEYYTIIDGQKFPRTPTDKKLIEDTRKPSKKSPEELPTAGVPSRKPKKSDDEKPVKRPKSPSKKDKLHPEDFPTAGRPSKSQEKTLLPFTKKPGFPEIDSTTTVESFESVSKVFDSKSTVIKDSQTFVDNQSSVEHYTIVNGERIPLGPADKKPIEELPAAGVPSRKPKKPEEKVPKNPESPSLKEKLHPEDFPAAGVPSRKDKKSKDKPEVPDYTTVENYEIIDQVVDVKEGISENISSKTVVDKYVTDFTDIKDTVITDRVDRVNKTFITENITDIKDINQVENITNIKKITDNKVIKIERVVKEPEPKGPHYMVPMKEQCICELCICGTSTRIE